MHEWFMWDDDGKPFIGTFAADGRTRVRLRDATEADRAAMYAGRLKYDRETDPTVRAWAEHVRRGGD